MFVIQVTSDNYVSYERHRSNYFPHIYLLELNQDTHLLLK